MPSVPPDPGSFRDPLSRVFVSDEAVVRGLAGDGLADFEMLEQSGLLRTAIDNGSLVASERISAETASSLGVSTDGWDGFLRHERIPFVSYPYEWPFEMLREAALVQLDLTARALDADLITKDATSYNVQFVGSRPVFIDVGSFERLEAGQPWYGYRQFCQLFLNPLLLQAHKDVPFQPWLRGSLDGIAPGELAALMSGRDRFRPGVLTHVWLQARAENRYADTTKDVKDDIKKAGFKKELIAANVRGLTKLVKKLRWKRSASTWSDYTERSHYSDTDLEQKADFVRKATASAPRDLVWDLGANDGYFSRIAAESARYVVAFDVDPLVVDRLYKELRAEANETILPLLMNLADPSPGVGWRGAERASVVDRQTPDLILGLAVIHHLAITNNIPVASVLDWFRSLACEVVLEFPHRDDPMVARLLRNKRDGLHGDYRLDAVAAEIERRFTVVASQTLPSGTRTMYHLSPT